MCVPRGSRWTWVVSPIPRCPCKRAGQYQSTVSSPRPAPPPHLTTARITRRASLLSPTVPISAAWLGHNIRSITEWVIQKIAEVQNQKLCLFQSSLLLLGALFTNSWCTWVNLTKLVNSVDCWLWFRLNFLQGALPGKSTPWSHTPQSIPAPVSNTFHVPTQAIFYSSPCARVPVIVFLHFIVIFNDLCSSLFSRVKPPDVTKGGVSVGILHNACCIPPNDHLFWGFVHVEERMHLCVREREGVNEWHLIISDLHLSVCAFLLCFFFLTFFVSFTLGPPAIFPPTSLPAATALPWQLHSCSCSSTSLH